MHAIFFAPAAVFCAVAIICWAVCVAIAHREHRAAPRPIPAADARPRGFCPVVIEGGLTAPLRPVQTPLRSPNLAGADLGARPYGG